MADDGTQDEAPKGTPLPPTASGSEGAEDPGAETEGRMGRIGRVGRVGRLGKLGELGRVPEEPGSPEATGA
ncbi:hypothetical protein T8K17_17915 [Thalassobaculum sp. OXR-137]|uniref:hypothetical protein n=1 Tax=Thalassobaculum sp. OXR-137 TaxID=3100173 RepID=UPI002AC8BD69|nr:hypothetical protein [Thalassobaculum sp. OXR-137]WPZ33108.1 hypothetical protein T8K17_17915 [Thalassobaculum sp. OXR-137]